MARPSKTPVTARAAGKQRVSPPGRLSPGMACDTAFRIIARRHLSAVLAQHEGTCRGDPESLHQIRIALTHLRTAIRFFSPMVEDATLPHLRAELKWLNGQLGLVRDLDVAIERVVAETGSDLEVVAELQDWDEKRHESYRLLARALRSARYRRLIAQTSAWIESGPWSTRRSKDAIRLRRCSLAEHATVRLAEWDASLIRKARKLSKLDVHKRHKLRLLNKRITYSIESLADLFVDGRRTKSILKQLRTAQRSLGQLNDDARGQALASSLEHAGRKAAKRFHNRKREKTLLRTARRAYQKLKKSGPLQVAEVDSRSEPDA